MTNNFCALCADLIEAVLSDDSHIDCTEIARRARAALGEADEPAVPAPPADGEVAGLVAEIRHFLAGYQQMRGLDPEHIYSIHRGDKMEAHITVSRLTRAAELLQRLSPPQPVPVGERPWEREGWCDVEGRFWAEHISRSGVASWRCAAASDLGGWAVRCLPAHALPLPEVGE